MTNVLLLSKNVLSNTCIFTVVLGIKKQTHTWPGNTGKVQKILQFCEDSHCQARCLQVIYFVCNERKTNSTFFTKKAAQFDRQNAFPLSSLDVKTPQKHH